MATATMSQAGAEVQRFVLFGVGWEGYQILLLEANGASSPSETSAAFPFLPMQKMARFLRESDRNNDTRWGRAFRAWLRNEIGTRFHQ